MHLRYGLRVKGEGGICPEPENCYIFFYFEWNSISTFLVNGIIGNLLFSMNFHIRKLKQKTDPLLHIEIVAPYILFFAM